MRRGRAEGGSLCRGCVRAHLTLRLSRRFRWASRCVRRCCRRCGRNAFDAWLLILFFSFSCCSFLLFDARLFLFLLFFSSAAVGPVFFFFGVCIGESARRHRAPLRRPGCLRWFGRFRRLPARCRHRLPPALRRRGSVPGCRRIQRILRRQSYLCFVFRCVYLRILLRGSRDAWTIATIITA